MGNGGGSDLVEGTGVNVLLVAVLISGFRVFSIRFWSRWKSGDTEVSSALGTRGTGDGEGQPKRREGGIELNSLDAFLLEKDVEIDLEPDATGVLKLGAASTYADAALLRKFIHENELLAVEGQLQGRARRARSKSRSRRLPPFLLLALNGHPLSHLPFLSSLFSLMDGRMDSIHHRSSSTQEETCPS